MRASNERYKPLAREEVALETNGVLHKDENERLSVEEIVERFV